APRTGTIFFFLRERGSGTRWTIPLWDRTGCFHHRLQPGLHQTSNRGRPPTAPRLAGAEFPQRPRKASVPAAGPSKRQAHPRGVPVRFQLGGRAADSETVVPFPLLAKPVTGRQSNPKRRGPETRAQGGVAGLVSQPLRFLQPPWSRSSVVASVRPVA